jgi:hypothetical protein
MMQPAIILSVSILAALGPDDGPIRVSAQVPSGTYYVGQAIPLQVAVISGKERPAVVAPKVPDADVALVGTGLKPLSATGIGDVVDERNLFVFRFRVVPRRSGTVEIPPVVARDGGRSGASRAIRLNVQAPPHEGRPAEFLGGVGPFEVQAGSSAPVVRAGGEVEYWIRVDGPGALGMSGAPDLARLDRLPLGLRVAPEGLEVVPDPPSRTFRYRLRPTRPGEAVIPPVRIAALDPQSGRYVTKVTSGVPLRVADVPRFDPSAIQYGEAPPSPAGWSRAARWAGWAAAAVGAIGALILAGRRYRARPGRDRSARRVAARIARGLDPSDGAPAIGREIVQGLSAYLQVAIDHPPGALTPDEAGRGIERASGRADLAARSIRLVAESDRAQFAHDHPSAETLAAEAKRLFEDLAKMRGLKEGEEPREAARTANQ